MPIPRFLMFTFENRSRASLNLLQGLGSSRRFQFRSYTGAPKYNKKRLDGQTLLPERPLDSHSQLRSWSTYILPAGVLVVVGAGIFLHYNDERRAVLKGQGTEREQNNFNGPKIGGPFTLVDTENRVVTERNIRGNWILLYFGYTSSPDVSPEEVQKIAEAIEILESKHNLKIVPVFVTIDPHRDSPSQLRAYLKEFDPRIVGLTGPITAIRQMAQEYRVYFRKVEEDGDDYLVESSHTMYLLNPNMEIVRCFGIEYDADQLSKDIVKEMNRTSK